MTSALIEARLDDLRPLVEAALGAEPEAAESRYFAGALARREGRFAEAIGHLEAASRSASDHVGAWGELALSYSGAGRHSAAVEAFLRALSLDPDDPTLLQLYGLALQMVGDHSMAAWALKRSVDIRPDDWNAQAELAASLADSGRTEEAVAHFEISLRLNPDSPKNLAAFGRLLARLGRIDDAAEVFRRAAEISHALEVDRLWCEGEHFLSTGHAVRALGKFKASLAIDPTVTSARVGLARALRDLGQLSEATRTMIALAEEAPVHRVAPHFHILADLLNEAPPDDIETYQAVRRAWAARSMPTALAQRVHSNKPDPERRLRIGFVSSTFCKNSSNEIVWPVVSGLDRRLFDVSLFSNVPAADTITEKYRSIADRWIDLCGCRDDQGAAMVAGAEIDILVDIAGLSMGGRLGVFAHKPAPIQVTAWGFPVGTGLPQIDWIMADRLFIRPEEQGGMAERVWYVSNWAGYAPPGADLIPSATPAKSKGHLTFGVFCRTEKITRAALGVWRRILDRVPSARFLLKSSSIKHDNHVAAIQRFFGQAGIDPSRLIVMGESNKEEHLRCHLGVDIALDAFPQVGGISTFEALWTGVPVVTLYGHVPSSRGAASILNAVGLPETIAQSPDHYVEIAVGLSSDLDRLERLRAECRPRLLASPAGNPQLYVAEVEAAFRDMWSLWCARPQV